MSDDYEGLLGRLAAGGVLNASTIKEAHDAIVELVSKRAALPNDYTELVERLLSAESWLRRDAQGDPVSRYLVTNEDGAPGQAADAIETLVAKAVSDKDGMGGQIDVLENDLFLAYQRAEAAEAEWDNYARKHDTAHHDRMKQLERAQIAEAALKDAEITLIAAREAGAENLDRAKAAEARIKELEGVLGGLAVMDDATCFMDDQNAWRGAQTYAAKARAALGKPMIRARCPECGQKMVRYFYRRPCGRLDVGWVCTYSHARLGGLTNADNG